MTFNKASSALSRSVNDVLLLFLTADPRDGEEDVRMEGFSQRKIKGRVILRQLHEDTRALDPTLRREKKSTF